jgi:hypothetical protein
LNLPAFLTFAGGMAEALAPSPEGLADWVQGGLAGERAA